MTQKRIKILSRSPGSISSPGARRSHPRQIHLTRDTNSSNKPGLHNESLMELPRGHTNLRPSASNSFPDYGGNARQVDFRASGGGAFPPPRGCDPPRSRTTTESFDRYATPVDQSSATLGNPRPGDFSIGRIPEQRRSKATRLASSPRPSHPCSREHTAGTESHRSRVYLVHLPRRNPSDKRTSGSISFTFARDRDFGLKRASGYQRIRQNWLEKRGQEEVRVVTTR